MADLINGNNYRNEITKEQQQLAKDNSLVIVFGASDDLIEFRGSFRDEQDCYEGGDIYFTNKGRFPNSDHLYWIEQIQDDLGIEIKLPLNKITAIWDSDIQVLGTPQRCSWSYKTDIPHETFLVLEQDEDEGLYYCQGIVFNINDLK